MSKNNVRQTALLAPRKEGIRCSKCGAEAPCSPGDVHGGAGCPSAAHGHHAEQISMCSHGGAHGAVDVAWRRYSPWIPLQEQPQAGTAGHWKERRWVTGAGGAAACADLCWSGTWRVVWSCVGALLEELSPVGSPCRTSSGKTASHGTDPTLESVLSITAIGERSPCPYLNPQAFSHQVCSHLLFWGERVREWHGELSCLLLWNQTRSAWENKKGKGKVKKEREKGEGKRGKGRGGEGRKGKGKNRGGDEREGKRNYWFSVNSSSSSSLVSKAHCNHCSNLMISSTEFRAHILKMPFSFVRYSVLEIRPVLLKLSSDLLIYSLCTDFCRLF